MPSWALSAGSIKPLVVYHGTDDTVAGASTTPLGARPAGFRPNLALCRPNTDFGQGFYVSTSEYQARQWPIARQVRTPVCGARRLVPTLAPRSPDK